MPMPKTKKAICFLGTGGLNVFNPDSLKGSNEVPHIYLTGVKLFNKPVSIGEDSPLEQDISVTEEIVFKSSQNVFAIDYVALDFQQLKNNQYAYIMEGFDQDWNYVGKQRTASYTNLNPGTYTFKVKATNNDGVWNEKPAEIQVVVLPPWYRTWWAFFLYAMMLVAGLVFLRRMIEMRERFKSDLRLKEKEKEQIRELDKLKTNFFTNISHEFRTPLTLIISPLERFFAENPDLPEKQKSQFKLIHRNAKQLLKLINQLLDLSKLEAGKFTPEISQSDIVEFLEKLTSSFKNLAEQKQIDLSFVTEPKQLMAFYDADILEKVVTNFLSNAFKYTPEKGKIEVILEPIYQLEGQLDKVQILVKDTGSGISPQHISNIFNRFYQIQESTQPQIVGTGVGLALCKELILLHRGDISVASIPQEGSTFKVILPVSANSFERSWIKETTKEIGIETPTILKKAVSKNDKVNVNSEKPIVLIAEDNEELREYIKEVLSENFEVLEADNGKLAWEKALNFIPDLIISDWMMPELTGVEFCGLVKENVKTSHIPVIILTSKSNNESKIVGWEVGADDYITKPFNANLLEVRVKNLLEIRRKLRERFTQEVEIQPKEITLNTADEHFLERAIRTVEENIDNPAFDIQQLESELKMSNMQLYRKLKSLTNLSGNEFIRNIRLKRAVQLLETESYTVSEIAYKVGFNDPSYFTRIFKKEYGKSPSEMRDKV
jgi:signal transduction histidine kinase/DNA-binding response OmpR family regulator